MIKVYEESLKNDFHYYIDLYNEYKDNRPNRPKTAEEIAGFYLDNDCLKPLSLYKYAVKLGKDSYREDVAEILKNFERELKFDLVYGDKVTKNAFTINSPYPVDDE